MRFGGNQEEWGRGACQVGKGGPGGRGVSGDEAWAWAGRPWDFFWGQEGGACHGVCGGWGGRPGPVSASWVTSFCPCLLTQEHKARVTELEQQVAQAKTRYSVALRNLEQISEQIHARRRGLPPQHPGPRRSSPVGAEAVPDGSEDRDSGILEGAEGGASEGGLGSGPTPDADTWSLLSLRTVASDLQKCDSVEHLRGLSDHTSLDGQELGPPSGSRGGRHQRSISL